MMIYDSPCETIGSFPDEITGRLLLTWSPTNHRLENSESSREEHEGKVGVGGCVEECLSLVTE